jgi:hypothetical protein
MSIIKLDIDFHKGVVSFMKKRLFWTMNIDNFKPISVKAYRTNGGYHIYLNTKARYSNYEIVLLQLALGSDTKRELYNHKRLRYMKSKDHWNVLFTEKWNGKKMISKEIYCKRVTDSINRFISKYTR